MPKKITTTIGADGEIEIKTTGFTGNECLKATEGLKRALGMVVDQATTDEYRLQRQAAESEARNAARQ